MNSAVVCCCPYDVFPNDFLVPSNAYNSNRSGIRAWEDWTPTEIKLLLRVCIIIEVQSEKKKLSRILYIYEYFSGLFVN